MQNAAATSAIQRSQRAVVLASSSVPTPGIPIDAPSDGSPGSPASPRSSRLDRTAAAAWSSAWLTTRISQNSVSPASRSTS